MYDKRLTLNLDLNFDARGLNVSQFLKNEIHSNNFEFTGVSYLKLYKTKFSQKFTFSQIGWTYSPPPPPSQFRDKGKKQPIIR